MKLVPMRVPPGPSVLLEGMRVIRNLGREGFINSHEEITPDQQEAWWHQAEPVSWAWVYRIDGSSELAGFGLVRPNEDGTLWTSVAVTPPQRGKGIGLRMTHHLIHALPERTIYGSGHVSNPAAVALHHPDEWDEIESDDPNVRKFMTSPAIRARKTEDRYEQRAIVQA